MDNIIESGLTKLTKSDKLYLNGGFKYDKDSASVKNLLKSCELLNGQGTLLDAGCGDGFWTEILSEYYETTGEDISKGGIYMANKNAKENNKNINYILTSCFEQDTKYDIVFSRHSSFFLLPVKDNTFLKNFNFLYSRCKKKFVCVLYKKYFNLPGERNAKETLEVLKKIYNKVKVKEYMNNLIIIVEK